MEFPRPIGTEFEYAYPPDQCSSNPAWHVWRYRIVAHDPIYDQFMRKAVGERLEPLERRDYYSTLYVHWFGKWMPVPPVEVLPLLSEDWQALASYASRTG